MAKLVGTALIAVAVVQGCATQKLSKEQLEAMRAVPTLHVIRYAPPPFYARTETNMALSGGLIPSLVAEVIDSGPKGYGKQIQNDYALEDPAVRTKAIVSKAFREKTGFLNLAAMNDEQKEGSLPKVSTSDRVLSFRTVGWDLMYYAMDTSFYYLIYGGEVQFINPKTSDTEWKGTCKYVGDAPKNSRPTMEELLDNNAAKLKAELNRAADQCAAQFLEQLL